MPKQNFEIALANSKEKLAAKRSQLVNNLDKKHQETKKVKDTIKPEKIVRLSVDMSDGLRRALKLYAVTNGTTINAVIERLIKTEIGWREPD
jgi:hypothetical protein